MQEQYQNIAQSLENHFDATHQVASSVQHAFHSFVGDAINQYVGSDAGETVMNIAKIIGKVIGLG